MLDDPKKLNHNPYLDNPKHPVQSEVLSYVFLPEKFLEIEKSRTQKLVSDSFIVNSEEDGSIIRETPLGLINNVIGRGDEYTLFSEIFEKIGETSSEEQRVQTVVEFREKLKKQNVTEAVIESLNLLNQSVTFIFKELAIDKNSSIAVVEYRDNKARLFIGEDGYYYLEATQYDPTFQIKEPTKVQNNNSNTFTPPTLKGMTVPGQTRLVYRLTAGGFELQYAATSNRVLERLSVESDITVDDELVAQAVREERERGRHHSNFQIYRRHFETQQRMVNGLSVSDKPEAIRNSADDLTESAIDNRAIEYVRGNYRFEGIDRTNVNARYVDTRREEKTKIMREHLSEFIKTLPQCYVERHKRDRIEKWILAHSYLSLEAYGRINTKHFSLDRQLVLRTGVDQNTVIGFDKALNTLYVETRQSYVLVNQDNDEEDIPEPYITYQARVTPRFDKGEDLSCYYDIQLVSPVSNETEVNKLRLAEFINSLGGWEVSESDTFIEKRIKNTRDEQIRQSVNQQQVDCEPLTLTEKVQTRENRFKLGMQPTDGYPVFKVGSLAEVNDSGVIYIYPNTTDNRYSARYRYRKGEFGPDVNLGLPLQTNTAYSFQKNDKKYMIYVGDDPETKTDSISFNDFAQQRHLHRLQQKFRKVVIEETKNGFLTPRIRSVIAVLGKAEETEDEETDFFEDVSKYYSGNNNQISDKSWSAFIKAFDAAKDQCQKLRSKYADLDLKFVDKLWQDIQYFNPHNAAYNHAVSYAWVQGLEGKLVYDQNGDADAEQSTGQIQKVLRAVPDFAARCVENPSLVLLSAKDSSVTEETGKRFRGVCDLTAGCYPQLVSLNDGVSEYLTHVFEKTVADRKKEIEELHQTAQTAIYDHQDLPDFVLPALITLKKELASELGYLSNVEKIRKEANLSLKERDFLTPKKEPVKDKVADNESDANLPLKQKLFRDFKENGRYPLLNRDELDAYAELVTGTYKTLGSVKTFVKSYLIGKYLESEDNYKSLLDSIKNDNGRLDIEKLYQQRRGLVSNPKIYSSMLVLCAIEAFEAEHGADVNDVKNLHFIENYQEITHFLHCVVARNDKQKHFWQGNDFGQGMARALGKKQQSFFGKPQITFSSRLGLRLNALERKWYSLHQRARAWIFRSKFKSVLKQTASAQAIVRSAQFVKESQYDLVKAKTQDDLNKIKESYDQILSQRANKARLAKDDQRLRNAYAKKQFVDERADALAALEYMHKISSLQIAVAEAKTVESLKKAIENFEKTSEVAKQELLDSRPAIIKQQPLYRIVELHLNKVRAEYEQVRQRKYSAFHSAKTEYENKLFRLPAINEPINRIHECEALKNDITGVMSVAEPELMRLARVVQDAYEEAGAAVSDEPSQQIKNLGAKDAEAVQTQIKDMLTALKTRVLLALLEQYAASQAAKVEEQFANIQDMTELTRGVENAKAQLNRVVIDYDYLPYGMVNQVVVNHSTSLNYFLARRKYEIEVPIRKKATETAFRQSHVIKKHRMDRLSDVLRISASDIEKVAVREVQEPKKYTTQLQDQLKMASAANALEAAYEFWKDKLDDALEKDVADVALLQEANAAMNALIPVSMKTAKVEQLLKQKSHDLNKLLCKHFLTVKLEEEWWKSACKTYKEGIDRAEKIVTAYLTSLVIRRNEVVNLPLLLEAFVNPAISTIQINDSDDTEQLQKQLKTQIALHAIEQTYQHWKRLVKLETTKAAEDAPNVVEVLRKAHKAIDSLIPKSMQTAAVGDNLLRVSRELTTISLGLDESDVRTKEDNNEKFLVDLFKVILEYNGFTGPTAYKRPRDLENFSKIYASVKNLAVTKAEEAMLEQVGQQIQEKGLAAYIEAVHQEVSTLASLAVQNGQVDERNIVTVRQVKQFTLEFRVEDSIKTSILSPFGLVGPKRRKAMLVEARAKTLDVPVEEAKRNNRHRSLLAIQSELGNYAQRLLSRGDTELPNIEAEIMALFKQNNLSRDDELKNQTLQAVKECKKQCLLKESGAFWSNLKLYKKEYANPLVDLLWKGLSSPPEEFSNVKHIMDEYASAEQASREKIEGWLGSIEGVHSSYKSTIKDKAIKFVKYGVLEQLLRNLTETHDDKLQQYREFFGRVKLEYLVKGIAGLEVFAILDAERKQDIIQQVFSSRGLLSTPQTKHEPPAATPLPEIPEERKILIANEKLSKKRVTFEVNELTSSSSDDEATSSDEEGGPLTSFVPTLEDLPKTYSYTRLFSWRSPSPPPAEQRIEQEAFRVRNKT